MPALFIGHGSPMNAILDNNFTKHLHKISQNFEKPNAVLVISAHWLTTNKTFVSVNPAPKAIYDFGGFPERLVARYRCASPGCARAHPGAWEALPVRPCTSARLSPCGSARLAQARRGTWSARQRAQVQRASARSISPHRRVRWRAF